MIPVSFVPPLLAVELLRVPVDRLQGVDRGPVEDALWLQNPLSCPGLHAWSGPSPKHVVVAWGM